MTTNKKPEFTRAEMRRLWKETKRKDRYEKSGFLDLNWGYIGSNPSSSKYTPHIGAKQKAKGAN